MSNKQKGGYEQSDFSSPKFPDENIEIFNAIEVVFFLILLAGVMISYFMYEDNSPVSLERTMKVMNEYDGVLAVGDVKLQVNDIPQDNVYRRYLHVPSYFIDEDRNVVYKEFSLYINDEVVEKTIHKPSDEVLELGEYTTTISKEIRDKYYDIVNEEDKQKKVNAANLERALEE